MRLAAIVLLLLACGEEESAPAPKAMVSAPRMVLCVAGSEGCAVGARAPVESYTIPRTPTPAEAPGFVDRSPRLAPPGPALPPGCLALLGSPPRGPLHSEDASVIAVSSDDGGSVLELSHLGARRHRVKGGSAEPAPLAGWPTGVTADGKVVALAIDKEGVRVARDGLAPGVLLEQSTGFLEVELDAGGTRAAAVHREGKNQDVAVLWDARSGRQLWRISTQGPEDWREGWRHIALAPDGWAVAIASGGTISVRDGRDGSELVLLGARERAISGIGFLPDGKRLAVAGSDLRVYDLTSGRQLAEVQLVEADQLAVDPATGRIATASADGALTVWEPSLEARASASLFRFPRTLAFSPDGALVAASHLGGDISLFQVDPPELLSGAIGHVGTAEAIASTPAGIVSIGAGRVCRWTGERPSCLEGYQHAALAPSGTLAIAIGAGVWLYRGDAAVRVASVDERYGVADVGFTGDGKLLLVLWGRSLELHDAASGRLLKTIALTDDTLADLHASSGKDALYSRGSDSHLFIADLTGKRPAVGPLDFSGFWSSAWAPDGRSAVAADWTLRRIDRSGKVLADQKLDGEVRAGAWSPDGSWYAAGSDRAVAAYAAAGNRPLWTSTAVIAPIAAIDRNLLAARDREQEGTVLLLDARTGRPRGALAGGELAGKVDRLVPLPGRRLAAAAWEGRILLWQVP